MILCLFMQVLICKVVLLKQCLQFILVCWWLMFLCVLYSLVLVVMECGLCLQVFQVCFSGFLVLFCFRLLQISVRWLLVLGLKLSLVKVWLWCVVLWLWQLLVFICEVFIRKLILLFLFFVYRWLWFRLLLLMVVFVLICGVFWLLWENIWIILLVLLLQIVEVGLCSISMCLVMLRLRVVVWFWLFGVLVGMLLVSSFSLWILKVEWVLQLCEEICRFWVQFWWFCIIRLGICGRILERLMLSWLLVICWCLMLFIENGRLKVLLGLQLLVIIMGLRLCCFLFWVVQVMIRLQSVRELGSRWEMKLGWGWDGMQGFVDCKVLKGFC